MIYNIDSSRQIMQYKNEDLTAISGQAETVTFNSSFSAMVTFKIILEGFIKIRKYNMI